MTCLLILIVWYIKDMAKDLIERSDCIDNSVLRFQ